MVSTFLAVVVDCSDPGRVAGFWAEALSREVSERNHDEYQVGTTADEGTPLYFMKVPEPRSGKNRLHVDVLASGPMEAEVERLVAAGASVLEVRQDPGTLDHPDAWTVMQDPEGNEFCVISSTTLTGWT